jgi:hypothetical protein
MKHGVSMSAWFVESRPLRAEEAGSRARTSNTNG